MAFNDRASRRYGSGAGSVRVFSAEKMRRNYHAPRPLQVRHGGGLAHDPIEWRWGPVDLSIFVPWGRDANWLTHPASAEPSTSHVSIFSGVRPNARPRTTMVIEKAVGFRRRFSRPLKMAQIPSQIKWGATSANGPQWPMPHARHHTPRAYAHVVGTLRGVSGRTHPKIAKRNA